MTDKVQKIRAFLVGIADTDGVSTILARAIEKKILPYIDSLQEESVSEDLGDYINELSKQFPEVSFAKLSRIAVRVAKWQKEHLWKPADGDDLPECEREVVVFTQNFPDDAGIMSVAIGHRPNPDGWDGKSLTTGEVEHYTPKTYDKGGWNISDVKFWLDVELPKEIEL